MFLHTILLPHPHKSLVTGQRPSNSCILSYCHDDTLVSIIWFIINLITIVIINVSSGRIFNMNLRKISQDGSPGSGSGNSQQDLMVSSLARRYLFSFWLSSSISKLSYQEKVGPRSPPAAPSSSSAALAQSRIWPLKCSVFCWETRQYKVMFKQIEVCKA